MNVAVATSLATTGPEITGVTMHSVPGWAGDDHCITAEIEGVKAVVDICSSTSAIAGWSVVALLRNLSSPYASIKGGLCRCSTNWWPLSR